MTEAYYDVVVVGSGASGMAAAVQAIDDGLSVLLLEKGRTIGGSSNYTEGMFAIGSNMQKEAGIEISKAQMLEEEMHYSNYRADSSIWEKYIDNSAATVNWLQEHGVEFDRVQGMGAGVKSWHIYKGFGDTVIVDTLLPYLESKGATVLTQHAGCKIHKDNDGKVYAIDVKDVVTDKIKHIETKAVVLATGGYLDNPEMVKDYTHYDTERLIPVSCGKDTGDGLRMGWEVGGKETGMGTLMLFGGYLDDPNRPAYELMRSQMCVAAGQQPLFWVNERGNRFVNEEVIYNFSQAGNALYTQEKVYSILDQGVIDLMATDGNFMGLGVYIERGDKMDELQVEIKSAVKAKKPYLRVADSIEDLAEQINVPVENLVAAVERYNKDAEAGEDSQFGKPAEYMVPLSTGPFYAFELSVGSFCSMGGLKINNNNEVLNEDGVQIPGLYAVGNDASGLVGDTYGPDKPGSCVGYAFYSGRNAALNIKEYVG